MLAAGRRLGTPEEREADSGRLARAMTALDGTRIRHTVVFDLRHAPGSQEEIDFLAAAERLAAIPGVEAFEVLREVSPKNGYRFGISMEFADEAAHTGYSTHPDHVRFVETRWLPEVSEFLEIDYAAR
jgi:stress responsive alpha/beta barrel protein